MLWSEQEGLLCSSRCLINTWGEALGSQDIKLWDARTQCKHLSPFPHPRHTIRTERFLLLQTQHPQQIPGAALAQGPVTVQPPFIHHPCPGARPTWESSVAGKCSLNQEEHLLPQMPQLCCQVTMRNISSEVFADKRRSQKYGD